MYTVLNTGILANADRFYVPFLCGFESWIGHEINMEVLTTILSLKISEMFYLNFPYSIIYGFTNVSIVVNNSFFILPFIFKRWKNSNFLLQGFLNGIFLHTEILSSMTKNYNFLKYLLKLCPLCLS